MAEGMVKVEVAGILSLLPKSQADVILAREAFVARYFAERGWDTGNPTMEQVLEVRAQAEWKNPLSG